MATFKIRGDNTEVVRAINDLSKQFRLVGQQASGDMGKISQSVEKTAFSLKGVAANVLGVAAGFLSAQAAMAAWHKGIQFIKSFETAFRKQEDAEERVRFALISIGKTVSQVMPEIKRKIDEVQFSRGIPDESSLELLSRLIDATGDYKRSLELIAPIMGYSTFTHRSYLSIVEALQRALNTGEMTGLRRYGIVLDDALWKTDKLGAVFKSFGKYDIANLIHMQSFGGQMDAIKDIMDDMKQEIATPLFQEIGKGLGIFDATAKEDSLSFAKQLGEELRMPARYFVASLMTGAEILKQIDLTQSFLNFTDRLFEPGLWIDLGTLLAKVLGNAFVGTFQNIKEFWRIATLSGDMRQAKSSLTRWGAGLTEEQRAKLQEVEGRLTGLPETDVPRILGTILKNITGAGILKPEERETAQNYIQALRNYRSAQKQIAEAGTRIQTGTVYPFDINAEIESMKARTTGVFVDKRGRIADINIREIFDSKMQELKGAQAARNALENQMTSDRRIADYQAYIRDYSQTKSLAQSVLYGQAYKAQGLFPEQVESLREMGIPISFGLKKPANYKEYMQNQELLKTINEAAGFAYGVPKSQAEFGEVSAKMESAKLAEAMDRLTKAIEKINETEGDRGGVPKEDTSFMPLTAFSYAR